MHVSEQRSVCRWLVDLQTNNTIIPPRLSQRAQRKQRRRARSLAAALRSLVRACSCCHLPAALIRGVRDRPKPHSAHTATCWL